MEKMRRAGRRGVFAKGAKRSAFAKSAKYTRAMVFAVLLLGVLAAAPGVWADEVNGKDIYLQPGDTYDAGGAGNNTTVYMDKAGSYTLKGNSDNIRFIIKTGGVTVYLADGLHIDPGAYADNGKSASAISVQHKSGDVTLISKAGASIYFGSHYRAPAIHQDGTDGNLIFNTEDPDNPGTITARSADWSESAAIGSGRQKGTTGNIYFKGGKIYATADEYAAAIGGGNGSKGRRIFISGGYVEAQGGQYAAGIGSGMYKGAAEITISGGEVVAKGGKGGAGIGSGLEIEITPIKGENIKITGGKVKAIGGTGAAAIGGGRNADGEHIEITGGTVTAKGGELGGAGIGGGGWFDPGGYGGDSFIGGDGRYITISGGTVTATGRDDGAGIGGGNEEGNGENITISGGSVVASGGGDGAGIGGALKGRAKDITITGGRVTANGSGGGAGIGGGSMAWGHDLKISGGIVRATGGKNGDGIGGGKKPGIFYKDFTNSVFISGGTVIAEKGSKGSADIGGRGKSTVSITGGSVLPRNNDINQAPKNQAGDVVYRTTVTFIYSMGEDYAKHKVDSLTFTDKTPKYGINDIYNVNSSYSAVWLWLPKKSGAGVVSGTLTEDDGDSKTTKKYTAMEVTDQTTFPWVMKQITIAPGTSGSVYQPNDIILDNGRNSNGLKDGSATGEFLEKKLGNFVPVSGSIPGMHIEGYSTSDNYEEFIIADAEGNLIPGVDEKYVNANGQWITAGSQVTLYAVWRVNYYNIRFDPNKPERASHEVTGKMDDQTELQYGEDYNLNHNTYQLKGWIFTGWNTDPDGNGVSYVDEQRVMNLTAKHDETITLYAQWESMKYTVTFGPGDGDVPSGTLEPYTQTIEYDTPTKLMALDDMTFTAPTGKAFLGWGRKMGDQAVGLYKDQATVYNLCTLDEASGALTGSTLEAQWYEANFDVVTVTLNGELVNIGDARLPGRYTRLGLRPADSKAVYDLQNNSQAPGLYTIHDQPAGTYDILLKKSNGTYDESGRILEITTDPLNVASLDYCTIDTEMALGSEDRGRAWLGGGLGSGPITLLTGQAIGISCDPHDGYRFVEYTVSGNVPGWTSDKTTANQTITAAGQAIITAHVEPIRYKVQFDDNAQDATGSMKVQDFVYGHPQKLFACGFAREGYTFAGWTVTPEWKSKADLYEDGTVIGKTTALEDNLSATHGDTVTLYAHWTPRAYDIFYDSNGAGSGIQLTQHRSYHDNTTRLFSAEKLDFSMDNYHFTGWNTRSGGDGTTYEAGQEVRNLSGGADSVTLYAQWKHDSYTVHYDANGGIGTMLDEEFWIDAYEPLHQVAFKKDGCIFAGWNTKRDGTGTSYQDREEVMNLAKTGGNVTLYAQWKKDDSGDEDAEDDSGGNMDNDSKNGENSKTGDGGGNMDNDSKNGENNKTGDSSSDTGDDGIPWMPVIMMTLSTLVAVSLALTRQRHRS